MYERAESNTPVSYLLVKAINLRTRSRLLTNINSHASPSAIAPCSRYRYKDRYKDRDIEGRY